MKAAGQVPFDMHSSQSCPRREILISFWRAPISPIPMFSIHKIEINAIVITHKAQSRCWNAFVFPLPSDPWAFGLFPVSHCYKHLANTVCSGLCLALPLAFLPTFWVRPRWGKFPLVMPKGDWLRSTLWHSPYPGTGKSTKTQLSSATQFRLGPCLPVSSDHPPAWETTWWKWVQAKFIFIYLHPFQY